MVGPRDRGDFTPGGRPASMVVETLAVAVWAMLPAYVPNNAAVLVGGGPPIDGGRTYGGRRLLGDGKTWRGTAGGIVAGVLLAVALDAVRPAVVAPAWVGRVFTLPVVVVVLVVTPVLHLSTNAGAYLLGLKEEPY